MKAKLITVVLFFIISLVSEARNLEFYYQPHESAGSDCTYTENQEMKDFQVQCGEKKFYVHFLARPYKRQDRLAWEVLYWVVNHKAGGSFLLDMTPDSTLRGFQVGQLVDNDTAELILKVK